MTIASAPLCNERQLSRDRKENFVLFCGHKINQTEKIVLRDVYQT